MFYFVVSVVISGCHGQLCAGTIWTTLEFFRACQKKNGVILFLILSVVLWPNNVIGRKVEEQEMFSLRYGSGECVWQVPGVIVRITMATGPSEKVVSSKTLVVVVTQWILRNMLKWWLNVYLVLLSLTTVFM